MTLDRITTIKGNCFDYIKYIPDNSIDMILCDPPYGTTRCKWDSVIDIDAMFREFNRIIKDNGAIVLFSAEPFTSLLVTANIRYFRYDMIWEKEQGTDFLNANRKPLKSHENILLFSRHATTYNKQVEQGEPYTRSKSHKGSDCYGGFKAAFTDNNGTRNPTTVLRFKRDRGFHPTQKPVDLLRWLVRTYSNEGDRILDPTMGSGSTGVACVLENRNFVGIELDERYFSIANERINNTAKETYAVQLSLPGMQEV